MWGYSEEAYDITQIFSIINFDAPLELRLIKFKVPMIRLASVRLATPGLTLT